MNRLLMIILNNRSLRITLMKKVLLLILIGFSANLKAQDASVEKNVFGIQAGFLGAWLHHEGKLSRQIALRSEIGLNVGSEKVFYGIRTNYVLRPVLSLEPRWYVGLNRRAEKNRVIESNSSNFFTVGMSYGPDWFTLGNEQYKSRPWLSFTPKVGVRRSLGKQFNYEAGLGIGELFYFKSSGYMIRNLAVAEIHLRIGVKL
jgi:hypothetical protein